MRRALLLLLVLPVVAGVYYVFLKPTAPSSFPAALPASAMPNFELFDTEGHSHELYRYADMRAVVIISQILDCPAVQKSSDTIRELSKKFSSQKVQLLALNPNPQDSKEAMAAEAKAYQMNWPILRDPSQLVARQLGFTSSAEAVVIDTKTWQVAYRGPIDNRLEFGVSKGKTTSFYLNDAIEAVLSGSPVKNSGLKAKGCAITYLKKETPPIYAGEIGNIIKSRCVNCHSEAGQMKPTFSSYESVTSWAAMIRQTVMTGKMPIWGIDAEPGVFQNDASLSPEQKRDLIDWIDGGMPRGPGKDPLAGYVPVVAHTPDPGAAFVASMKEEIDVPPAGLMDYSYFEIGQVPRDMWVSAVEAFSSNPRAMHHATLNVMPSPLSYYSELASKIEDKAKASGEFRGSEIWMYRAMKNQVNRLHTENAPVPKNSPYDKHELIRFSVYSMYGRNNKRILPKNTARFLPKGYYLILETHHHETGKPEKEKTSVYFYEKKVMNKKTKPLRRLDQIGTEVVIPAYAKNFRFDLPTYVAEKDISLLACNSHMHARGKELHAWAVLPDKSVKNILTIPSFNYNWHSAAQMFYEKPIELPAGTRIYSYAIIDNSATNPYNPDPSKEIVFGQSLDKHEMPKFQCILFNNEDYTPAQ